MTILHCLFIYLTCTVRAYISKRAVMDLKWHNTAFVVHECAILLLSKGLHHTQKSLHTLWCVYLSLVVINTHHTVSAQKQISTKKSLNKNLRAFVFL